MKKAIIVSGYFNPLHKGHLELFQKAKALGDILIVIVNSDHQRKLKGSSEFMDEEERATIVDNIKVDYKPNRAVIYSSATKHRGFAPKISTFRTYINYVVEGKYDPRKCNDETPR